MNGPDPRRSIAALIAAIAVTFVLFALFPSVDLWVAGLFYDDQVGFALTDVAVTDAFRRVIWSLTEVTAFLALAAVSAGLIVGRPILRMQTRTWTFVVLTFLLGPGLLVNAILKRYWGRARPADIIEFGGSSLFTPPHHWTDECARNCSFVSGEVAGAVALAIALIVILCHWRDRMARPAFATLFALAFAVPFVVGLQRVASGRHFLSDVTLSALFVLLIAAVLSFLMFRRPKS
jgi:lipid A 4'-phosphatase